MFKFMGKIKLHKLEKVKNGYTFKIKLVTDILIGECIFLRLPPNDENPSRLGILISPSLNSNFLCQEHPESFCMLWCQIILECIFALGTPGRR